VPTHTRNYIAEAVAAQDKSRLAAAAKRLAASWRPASRPPRAASKAKPPALLIGKTRDFPELECLFCGRATAPGAGGGDQKNPLASRPTRPDDKVS
jgi:hypothetical protein